MHDRSFEAAGFISAFRGLLRADPPFERARSHATHLSLVLLVLSAPALAQIERISVTDAGAQADSDSYEARISDDGTVVAFRSAATNLVAGDSNGWSDIFVRDLGTGSTELISLTPDGNSLDVGLNHRPSISDDGRRVLFSARYPTGGAVSLPVLRDRDAGTSDYLFLDRSTSGAANRPSFARLNGELSGNGQFVVFDSKTTLQTLFEPAIQPADDDQNSTFDVFLHDVVTDPPPQIERLSRDSLGEEGRGDSIEPSVSDSGRWVAFHSYADDLVSGDLNERVDVFVKDRDTGVTELVSANTTGEPGNHDSVQAAISGNGQVVAFRSRATDLVANDTETQWDIFVRDRGAVPPRTERVSVASDGTPGNHHSTDARLSDDGRFVVFRSLASNLVADDSNGRADVFVHDRTTGQTAIVSRPITGESNGTSHAPAISGDGAWIVFESDATNLVVDDTNRARDIFRAPNPLLTPRAGE